MVDLQSTIEILSRLRPQLIQKYHITTLGLFGSIVRTDFNENSDIDIIVDFSEPIGIEFIELADYIETQLHKQVDLVSKKGMKQAYFLSIEKDIIYV
jgi:predicted nucleotidyltransferase